MQYINKAGGTIRLTPQTRWRIIKNMKLDISKRQAVGIFLTQSNLARALGISRQAVSLWPEDKPIPEVHALRIRYQLRPELFPRNSA